MADKLYTLVTLFLLVAYSLDVADSTATGLKCKCASSIRRATFPQEFIFGAASSAYQYEGAYDENGKGQSMWDNFTHTCPGKMSDQSNGDIAIDSYHRYKEDVKLARDLGIDAYRISISWPRILPGGTIRKGVNQDGLNYYNNLINELLANGIQPFVTIFHFDIPQALEDAYGGFLSAQMVVDFLDFAEFLFQQFGDRVKYWTTINEPWTFSVYGYASGIFAPGRCSDWQGLNCTGGDSATEPYVVMHNQLLAHAAVVNLYRSKYQAWQMGKIGITLASYWFEPYDETNENRKAKDRIFDFLLGWILEPLTVGEYPESIRIRVRSRLPKFTHEESNMVKGSYDFIGLNYYGAMYALNKSNSSSYSYTTDTEVVMTGDRNGQTIGERASNSSQINIYPKGFREILKHIKLKYNDPLIYITENGIDEATSDTLEVAEAVKDDMRKEYIHDHLCCLQEAIKKEGVKVNGYFVWSLMDNFEWSSGFSARFGLHYVDFDDNLSRYPKQSALWFKEFLLKENQEHLPHVSDQ